MRSKMKDFYSDYTADELWLIKETKWVKQLQSIREAQFTLGNGYLGTRGIYEEVPYDAQPGTYISGIYDKMSAQVSELVNLPNPINFKFTVKGEKIDLAAMDSLTHKRTLNMKKGVLARKTLYQDSKKRRYDYQSLRFISQHNKNIGAMQIVLTSLDAACVVDINTGIDTSISNAGVLTEGRKRHFRLKELGQSHNAGYLAVETLEKKYTIIYWSGFYYESAGKKIFAKDNVFRLKLKKNQTVIFTKVFCIKHFFPHENSTAVKKHAFKIFHNAFHRGFSNLLASHIKVWEKLWKKADILIEAEESLQQNLRFNIYHMLICGHFDNGFSSIGARTLSGEGYRGHIFWDAEIFLLPFYLFNFPRVAKNMLLYRYRRLDKARELAKEGGFKGAKFAWESADTGEEETPEWARDIDRTIIKIYTHKMEDHITADIAYAVYKYYQATNDDEFMENFGYEILFETARFWASRVEYNKKKKRHEINHIIGPDEFHINVNNNAYTNIMVRWNLLAASKLFAGCIKKRKVYKKLTVKLNLKEKEVKEWKKIASKLAVNINKKGVIEQFDGYFKLDKVKLKHTDENGIPLIPAKIKAKGLGKTRLVKQADVLMFLYLLDDSFGAKTKIANYEFYTPQTVYKSSLSPSIYSLIASRVGDLHRAYNLFNVALRADIDNLYENTPEGIHAACLGGTWQAVVFGFGGVKIKKERLSINPCMPRTWGKITFSLAWREFVVKLELTNEVIKVKVVTPAQKTIEIDIFSRLISVKTNKVYVFKRRTVKFKEERYHY